MAQSNAVTVLPLGGYGHLKQTWTRLEIIFLNKQNIDTNRRENSPKYCPYSMKQNTFLFCVLFYTTVSDLINTFSLYFNRLEVAISQKLVPRFLFRFVHKHNYTRASYVNTCTLQYFPNFPTTWWYCWRREFPLHTASRPLQFILLDWKYSTLVTVTAIERHIHGFGDGNYGISESDHYGMAALYMWEALQNMLLRCARSIRMENSFNLL